jgi:hypothetical protein
MESEFRSRFRSLLAPTRSAMLNQFIPESRVEIIGSCDERKLKLEQDGGPSGAGDSQQALVVCKLLV